MTLQAEEFTWFRLWVVLTCWYSSINEWGVSKQRKLEIKVLLETKLPPSDRYNFWQFQGHEKRLICWIVLYYMQTTELHIECGGLSSHDVDGNWKNLVNSSSKTSMISLISGSIRSLNKGTRPPNISPVAVLTKWSVLEDIDLEQYRWRRDIRQRSHQGHSEP